MPANLRSAEDANAQALVESYLNTHPEATRAEAIAAVGAEDTYEHLDAPSEVYIAQSEYKEYDETPNKDWFYANPKADDVEAQKAGHKGENEVVLDDEPKQLAEDPDPDFDPSKETVESVVGYVYAHPEHRDEVLEAEREGKNRKTVFTQLDEPYEDDED